jgi:hypothetical protein
LNTSGLDCLSQISAHICASGTHHLQYQPHSKSEQQAVVHHLAYPLEQPQQYTFLFSFLVILNFCQLKKISRHISQYTKNLK